jgi:hypothetical protein
MHRTFSVTAALLAAGLSLDACTLRETASTPAVPAIESASASRVPGTFVLDIEPGPLSQEARLSGTPPFGWACRLNSYPVDAAPAFANAVRDAIGQVVERVEPGAARPGTAGVITIRPTRFDPSVSLTPGLAGPTAQGIAAIDATVTVDGPGGRIETAISGYGSGAQRTNAPIGCQIRGEAAAAATERAIADFAQRLATRLADAPELRAAVRRAPLPGRMRGDPLFSDR